MRLLASGVVVELAYKYSLPLTAAAVTPGILAALIAAAKPVTVLFVDAGTSTSTLLINKLAAAVKLVGVAVP